MRFESTPDASQLPPARCAPVRRLSLLSGLALLAGLCVLTAFARGEEPRLLAVVTPVGGITPSRAARTSSGWTDNQCGRCHTVDPLFSHPVNIVPSMNVPGNLPLENGRLTCVTCHESSAESHAAARASNTYNLRMSTAADLCGQCHDATQATRIARHALGLRRAHLAWPGKSSTGSSISGDRQVFDEQTLRCLSCHDGVMSTDVTISRNAALTDLLSEHPVGVSMEKLQAATPNPEPMTRAPTLIDSRIKLFNNRVGCTSCHSPFSSQPKLLVMSNHDSALCLSCHGD